MQGVVGLMYCRIAEVTMILVTGSAGHIGNVLARELLSRGERVRAMVLPGEDLASIQGLGVEQIEGNVLDPASLDRAMAGVDVVYHLAGVISILPGDEATMHRVNVEGAQNVAQAALKAGVRRMVHTSSVHAFRRLPHGETVDETTPLVPDSCANAYDTTKALGTMAVLNEVNRGLDAVIVCPSGVIGPFDFNRSEMGQTVADFARKKPHILVDGAYDFVDVRDVARGLILAEKRGRTGELYILSGTQVQLAQIRNTVQEIAGIRMPIIILPFGLAGVLARLMERIYRITRNTPRFTSYALQTVRDNSAFSHAKAERELGYISRALRDSLADTIAWWRAYEAGTESAN